MGIPTAISFSSQQVIVTPVPSLEIRPPTSYPLPSPTLRPRRRGPRPLPWPPLVLTGVLPPAPAVAAAGRPRGVRRRRCFQGSWASLASSQPPSCWDARPGSPHSRLRAAPHPESRLPAPGLAHRSRRTTHCLPVARAPGRGVGNWAEPGWPSGACGL